MSMSDYEHRFSGPTGGLGTPCTSVLGNGAVCGQPWGSPIHPPELEWLEAPTEKLTILQVPPGIEEPLPSRVHEHASEQAYGHARADTLAGAGSSAQDGVRERAREPGFAAVDGGGRRTEEKPLWLEAAEALNDSWAEVLDGPWPVRKYRMIDEGSELARADHHWEEYRGYCASLDRIGQEYMVVVYRVDGEPYRFALVTWSWAMGREVGVLADEFALAFDRS